VTATRSFPVLIVGGGSGGLGVAARLAAVLPPGSVAVVEPSETHYYQPLWTLVGGGVFPKEITARPEADYIPDGVVWIRDRVRGFDPTARVVETASGERLGYEQLVVALGIQLDWHKIDGAAEASARTGCARTTATTWSTRPGRPSTTFTAGNASSRSRRRRSSAPARRRRSCTWPTNTCGDAACATRCR
jgi:sulfide:quinone oxidoreductase